MTSTSTVFIILSLLVEMIQSLYFTLMRLFFGGGYNLLVHRTSSVTEFILIALAFLFSLVSFLTKGADRPLQVFNTLLSTLLGIIYLNWIYSAFS